MSNPNHETRANGASHPEQGEASFRRRRLLGHLAGAGAVALVGCHREHKTMSKTYHDIHELVADYLDNNPKIWRMSAPHRDSYQTYIKSGAQDLEAPKNEYAHLLFQRLRLEIAEPPPEKGYWSLLLHGRPPAHLANFLTASGLCAVSAAARQFIDKIAPGSIYWSPVHVYYINKKDAINYDYSSLGEAIADDYWLMQPASYLDFADTERSS